MNPISYPAYTTSIDIHQYIYNHLYIYTNLY